MVSSLAIKMNIRCLHPDDIPQLRRIHEKYYIHEFTFDDFITGIISAFTIEDSDTGEIVTAGGIRPIIECVAITNKDFSVRERREALYNLLAASTFAANRYNYSQLHAFIQDENWLRQLKKTGFRETVGKSLVMNI